MSMKKKVISYINKVIYFNFLKCVVVHMKRNLSDMFFFSSSYCMLFVFLIFMKLYKVIHLTSIYSILHLKTHYKINNQYIKKNHLPNCASQYKDWSLCIFGSHPYTTDIRLAITNNGRRKLCIMS